MPLFGPLNIGVIEMVDRGAFLHVVLLDILTLVPKWRVVGFHKLPCLFSTLIFNSC